LERANIVTGSLKVLNLGGIKMPTSTAFDFQIKGCIDAEMGGLSHVERTTRAGIEHQRDRKKTGYNRRTVRKYINSDTPSH